MDIEKIKGLTRERNIFEEEDFLKENIEEIAQSEENAGETQIGQLSFDNFKEIIKNSFERVASKLKLDNGEIKPLCILEEYDDYEKNVDSIYTEVNIRDYAIASDIQIDKVISGCILGMLNHVESVGSNYETIEISSGNKPVKKIEFIPQNMIEFKIDDKFVFYVNFVNRKTTFTDIQNQAEVPVLEKHLFTPFCVFTS